MDLSERGASVRRHPWETARSEFFLGVLGSAVSPGRHRMLDVGAGDSWLGAEVARAMPDTAVVCWDSAYTDADLEEAPDGVRRTRLAPSDDFDVVLMMDVLEHVADPVAFLGGEVAPRIAPGALVLASVPAHQRLFGPHDEALGHFRRYDPAEFVAQMSTVCDVHRHGPLFASLAVARSAQLAIGRWRLQPPESTGIGDWRHGHALTGVLRGVLRVDAAACSLAARLGVPVPGLSHWAVGIAPGASSSTGPVAA